MNAFLSQVFQCEFKREQPRQGLELKLSIPFPTMITVMLSAPPFGKKSVIDMKNAK